jgi:hypothetical protein
MHRMESVELISPVINDDLYFRSTVIFLTEGTDDSCNLKLGIT